MKPLFHSRYIYIFKKSYLGWKLLHLESQMGNMKKERKVNSILVSLYKWIFELRERVYVCFRKFLSSTPLLNWITKLLNKRMTVMRTVSFPSFFMFPLAHTYTGKGGIEGHPDQWKFNLRLDSTQMCPCPWIKFQVNFFSFCQNMPFLQAYCCVTSL